MRPLFSIFSLVVAGWWSAVLPTNAQVNVTQEHNNLSRDGLYIDSAFTPSAAASVTRDLNFNGTISGNVYAQPLYIENGPGGASMVPPEKVITIPSGSTRLTFASLYSFPSVVLKSSATTIDVISAAKIAIEICQYFTRRGFCLFSSPHSNDKVTDCILPHAPRFAALASFSSSCRCARYVRESRPSGNGVRVP